MSNPQQPAARARAMDLSTMSVDPNPSTTALPGATSAAQMAAAAQAAAPAVEYDPHAIYLIPDVEGEREAADAWRFQNAEHIPEDQFVTMLPINSVNRLNKVFVLCRRPERGKWNGKLRDSMPVVAVEMGLKILGHVPPDEIAKDFKAYGPIDVSTMWLPGQTRFSSKIDRDAFTGAVAQLARPWVIAFHDGNARKAPELPNEMYIR